MRFSVRTLLMITAGVAVAIPLLAKFPLVLSGIACTGTYAYLVVFCVRNPQHRMAAARVFDPPVRLGLRVQRTRPHTANTGSHDRRNASLPSGSILKSNVRTTLPRIAMAGVISDRSRAFDWHLADWSRAKASDCLPAACHAHFGRRLAGLLHDVHRLITHYQNAQAGSSLGL